VHGRHRARTDNARRGRATAAPESPAGGDGKGYVAFRRAPTAAARDLRRRVNTAPPPPGTARRTLRAACPPPRAVRCRARLLPARLPAARGRHPNDAIELPAPRRSSKPPFPSVEPGARRGRRRW
jgi:hypothetical protein